MQIIQAEIDDNFVDISGDFRMVVLLRSLDIRLYDCTFLRYYYYGCIYLLAQV